MTQLLSNFFLVKPKLLNVLVSFYSNKISTQNILALSPNFKTSVFRKIWKSPTILIFTNSNFSLNFFCLINKVNFFRQHAQSFIKKFNYENKFTFVIYTKNYCNISNNNKKFIFILNKIFFIFFKNNLQYCYFKNYLMRKDFIYSVSNLTPLFKQNKIYNFKTTLSDSLLNFNVKFL